MASYYYKASIMIAAAIICIVNGISWQESSDAFWAHGCDFVNDDMSNVRVSGEECSGACGATASCTHFAWSQYQDGTCWLKARAGGINRDSAIVSTQPGIVCGVMKTNSAPLSTVRILVPEQNSCREGATSCEWWEKQQRSLLNGDSQCESQFTCKFYGFNSKSECESACT